MVHGIFILAPSPVTGEGGGHVLVPVPKQLRTILNQGGSNERKAKQDEGQAKGSAESRRRMIEPI